MKKAICINKYYLLLVIVTTLLSFTMGPRIVKAINYEKAPGIVRYLLYRETEGVRRKSTVEWPLVDFTVDGKPYSCYGSRFQNEELFMHDKVTVIYNPKDPNRAYVYSFLGFWGPPLFYLFPLMAVLILGFGLEYIPRIIIIKI